MSNQRLEIRHWTWFRCEGGDLDKGQEGVGVDLAEGDGVDRENSFLTMEMVAGGLEL
jgi:hypothetical protein